MIHDTLDSGNLHADSKFVRLIRKYAILLSCFILLDIVFRTALPIVMNMFFSLQVNTYYNLISYFPYYAINFVTAIIVYQDMTETNSKSSAIIVLTCMANEIGVAFFLVSLLYRQLVSKTEK
jgi:ABC-type polysaccharide transport system permease subunit